MSYSVFGNDHNAALKAAGEMFIVDGVTLTKANQREYMQQQEHNINAEEIEKMAQIDNEQEQEETTTPLPPYPAELDNLPGHLGDIQDFIYNRMTYPSKAVAAMTALATLTSFAQTNILIDSREGLGFNEFYLFLMPTGFGKEDLRKPPEVLFEKANIEASRQSLPDVPDSGNLAEMIGFKKVVFRYAMPASPQGIHQLLESNRSIFFLADEFAEWLKTTHKNAIKQESLGYTMQAYTRATGTIEPGNAVTQKYTPVKNPRLSILATSTADAMFGTMTEEQANSGAYNRMVVFVGDHELPKKRYDGLEFEPNTKLVQYVTWLINQPIGQDVLFSEQAWVEFKQLDNTLAEPIKRKDGQMGGRLAEQAIKMAGLLALSDKRYEITPADLKIAFNIRIGLYHRACRLASQYGCMNTNHPTVQAMEQVRDVFKRKSCLYSSQIEKHSRKFKQLSIRDRNDVIKALTKEGTIESNENNQKKLSSLIYLKGQTTA